MTAFGVDVAELTGHAERLAALAEELAGALEAIGAAQLGDAAYGRLGAPLAAKLNELQDAGSRSIANATEGLLLAATDVRDAAAEYAETDQDNEQGIEDSGEGVGD
ncbi:MAG TPA: type VII secretion target [Actinophytocola sp.]|uniref:type VII secretion target n=1 Tax=Actinophytocola sp. TaxID=1872138 RepID=UPI002DB5A544|nr:type VII secretion target [Actinophytocola sp.]HEU5471220.1 type VII secretion target [Actinophytocola sp.]